MFSKKNIQIALIVIILLGAFLRFYKLGNNSFVADEFLDINSTYAYFKTGIWQNWDFNFGKVNNENVFEARDERAWIYKWQVAQIFKILPPTEATARTVSALWGILSIIIIYFAGNYFTKRKTIGIISAFLFAVSIMGIEFDRKLRMYAMFLPIYFLFSWFFYKFLEEKYEGKLKFLKVVNERWGFNFLFLVPVLFFGVLSFLAHQLTVNFVAVAAFYLIIWVVASYRSGNKFRNKYVYLIGMGILGVILLTIFYPGEISSNLGGLQFFNNHWEYFGIIFSDYKGSIPAFLFALLGIYFIYRKREMKREGSFLAVSFFVPLLMAIFLWSRNVGDQYIFFVKPFEIVLIASGIYCAADFFKENLRKNGNKAYVASIILALLIVPNYSYFFEKDNAYNQTSDSSNPNYRKIFTYFKKSKKEGDVLITRNFRNYYWSGAKVKVFDFGGELAKEKLSLEDVKKITSENKSGWLIFSDNDESYISNDVVIYAEKNFEKVSNVQVRGKIKVFRWNFIE